ncbi:conserved hypothetical protein [Ricinus communis]|uniref:Uncharacterized protein n=1 Tax=Ricinus communis TaxID=3988 RepID=B9S0S0_RICCO|nr:conserved hypothetical protein [Ricinus communis]
MKVLEIELKSNLPLHAARFQTIAVTISSFYTSTQFQAQANSSCPSAENNAQKSREVECQPNSHGMQVSQLSSSSTSALSKNYVN